MMFTEEHARKIDVARAVAADFENAGFDEAGRPARKDYIAGITAWCAEVLVTVGGLTGAWVEYMDPDDVAVYLLGVVAAEKAAAVRAARAKETVDA